jgi:tetratricopeptide (TPR) repeat protein
MIEIGIDDAPDSAKLQSALFYLHTSQFLEAKGMIDLLDENYVDKYSSVLSVKGWINLRYEDVTSDDPGPIFDEALKKTPFQGRKDLDALMGRARAYERDRRFEESIKVLNAVIVDFSQFLPAYLAKSRVLVALDEWEQADKALSKMLQDVDPDNIEALSYRILYVLTRNYEPAVLSRLFQSLIRSVKKKEPRNDKLFAQIASVFGGLIDNEEYVNCSRLFQN